MDVISGALTFSAAQASVGPSGSALVRSQLNFTAEDNFYGAINSSGSTYTVSLGGASEAFTQSGLSYTSQQQDGSTLTYSSSAQQYTYTTSSGTVAVFNTQFANANPVQANVAQIQSLTKPNGETLTYSYGVYVISYGNPKEPSTENTYWLAGVTSNRGLRITYTYNGTHTTTPFLTSVQAVDLAPNGASGGAYSFSGQQVTDPVGLVTNYGVVAASSSQVIIKPSGARITVGYDGSSRVTSYSTGIGTWSYSYSISGSSQTTTVTDPNSNKRTYVSNTSSDVLTSYTDEMGRTTYYYYDPTYTQRVTQVTLPHGDSYQYSYDGYGNNTAITHTVAGGGSSYTAFQASYGGCGQPASIVNEPCWTRDANGNQTTYAYNAQGLLTTKTSPAGASGVQPQVRYSYSQLAANLATGGTAAPIWLLTGVSSCGKGSTSGSTNCVGTSDEQRITISYDANHNLAPSSVTTAAGDGSISSTLGFGYDGLGNLISSTSPLGAVTTYAYDADRRPTEVKGPDPDGSSGPLVSEAVQTVYDSGGRVQYTNYGTDNGSFSQSYYDLYSYDSADRLVGQRRGPVNQGAVSYLQYTYDNANRLTCAALRMNASQFNSEPASACTLGSPLLSGPDKITQINYNADGTKSSVVSGYGTPQSHTSHVWSYNSDGLLGIDWDGNNNATCYGYDGYGRKVVSYYELPSQASDCNGNDYDYYGYDNKSEMTSWRKRDGSSYTFSYDALGNMTSGIDGDSYAWDNNHHLLKASRSTGGSTQVSFAYDALYRMTSATNSAVSGTTTYAYDAAGNRTQLHWPDGGYWVQYDHDVLGRTVDILEAGINSGDYHQIARYGYDSLGRLTASVRMNTETLQYGYDGVSRLQTQTYSFPNAAYNTSLNLAYDEASEVTYKGWSNSSMYDWNPSSPNSSITYGLNHLDQVTSAGAAAINYDAKGNLTGDGTGGVLGYNSHNWLISSNNGTSLVYDALGRTSSVNANNTTTDFLYDGAELIGEYSTSGSSLRRYVPGLGGDDYVSWVENQGSQGRMALLTDNQGSVIAPTETNGVPYAINSYDEYGLPGSSNAGRIQYTGQAYMPEIGYYNDKARMYSPTLGRFLQTDPIGYAGGMNWYAYTRNDPVNGTDPSGLLPTPFDVGLGAAVGFSVGLFSYAVGSDHSLTSFASNVGYGTISGAATAFLSPNYIVQTLGGAALAGGADALAQLTTNHFDLSKINLVEVGLNAAGGGLAGTAGFGILRAGIRSGVTGGLGHGALAVTAALHSSPASLVGAALGAKSGEPATRAYAGASGGLLGGYNPPLPTDSGDPQSNVSPPVIVTGYPPSLDLGPGSTIYTPPGIDGVAGGGSGPTIVPMDSY